MLSRPPVVTAGLISHNSPLVLRGFEEEYAGRTSRAYTEG